jgi:hypothetical protein
MDETREQSDGRPVSLWGVLGDIKLGRDHPFLMKKYGLSRKGVEDLFSQLAELGFLNFDGVKYTVTRARTIKASELLQDLRHGLTEKQLVAKYRISTSKLKKVMARLRQVRGLPFGEDSRLGGEISDDDIRDYVPRMPRNYLPYPFPVRVVGDPTARGLIMNITENGTMVSGIDVHVGQTKTFAVVLSRSPVLNPFGFEAECVWTHQDKSEGLCAGYSITRITDFNRSRLQKFIQFVCPS